MELEQAIDRIDALQKEQESIYHFAAQRCGLSDTALLSFGYGANAAHAANALQALLLSQANGAYGAVQAGRAGDAPAAQIGGVSAAEDVCTDRAGKGACKAHGRAAAPLRTKSICRARRAGAFALYRAR